MALLLMLGVLQPLSVARAIEVEPEDTLSFRFQNVGYEGGVKFTFDNTWTELNQLCSREGAFQVNGAALSYNANQSYISNANAGEFVVSGSSLYCYGSALQEGLNNITFTNSDDTQTTVSVNMSREDEGWGRYSYTVTLAEDEQPTQALIIPTGCDLTLVNLRIHSGVKIVVESGAKLTLRQSTLEGIAEVYGTFSCDYDSYNGAWLHGSCVNGQVRMMDGSVLDHARIVSHTNYSARDDENRKNADAIVTVTGSVSVRGDVYLLGDEAPSGETGQTALSVDGTLNIPAGSVAAVYGGGTSFLTAEGGDAIVLNAGTIQGEGSLIAVGGFCMNMTDDQSLGNGGAAVSGSGTIDLAKAYLEGGSSFNHPAHALDGDITLSDTTCRLLVSGGSEQGDTYWKGTGDASGIVPDTTAVLALVPDTPPAAWDIANATVTGLTDKTYTGAAITQSPVVELNGVTLAAGTDYELSYKDNVNAGTATVTITGTGSYHGTTSSTFAIKKANQTVNLTGKASMYVGAAQTLKATGKGSVTYTSSNTKVATVSAKGIVTAKAAGKVTITATFAGDQNHNKSTKVLTIAVKKYATPKVTKVENVAGGVKLTLKKTPGAAKHRIFYKTGKGKWTKLADTTASTYTWKKAKNGTKYTFTVRCVTADGKIYTSDYDKTGKTITYAASPTLTSVKNAKSRTATAAWKKLTGVTGFQIQYSTSKTFQSGNKTVTVKKAAATSQDITGLTKGKTYYFRIRSFKTVSGKNVFSGWSAAKSLKITK